MIYGHIYLIYDHCTPHRTLNSMYMCVTVTTLRSGLNVLSPYTRKLALSRNKDLVGPGGDRRPQAVSTQATGSHKCHRTCVAAGDTGLGFTQHEQPATAHSSRNKRCSTHRALPGSQVQAARWLDHGSSQVQTQRALTLLAAFGLRLVFGPCTTWVLQMERDAMLCVFVMGTGRGVAFELRGGRSSIMERTMRCVQC